MILAALLGCAHALEVKNLSLYTRPTELVSSNVRPDIAILSFNGTPDEAYFHNAIVEKLMLDPAIQRIRTNYMSPQTGVESSAGPDLVLSIEPRTEYQSSAWNFPIDFPGYAVFTSSWHGYVYRANITTYVDIHDGDGMLASSSIIPISYEIRQADLDRTVMTSGLSWCCVLGIPALIGGIRNSMVFDSDIIAELGEHVRANYAAWVYTDIAPKITAAAEARASRAREP